MRLHKVFLAIGCYLLLCIIEQYEKLKRRIKCERELE